MINIPSDLLLSKGDHSPSGCGVGEIAGFMYYGNVPFVSLSPNPASSELNIQSSENIDDARINILNTIGDVIVSKHTGLSKISGT